MRRKLGIAALLFFACLAFQSTFITLDAFVSDEGIVMVAADDVANGRLLYRDCNVPLTPTVYLLQGLAFKLFGSTFAVSRALIAIVYACCVCMVYALALCHLPLRQAAIAGALAIPLQIWMWPHAQFFSYNTLTILLCLVAMRFAWSIEAGPHRLRAALFFGGALAAGLWTKANLPVATGAGVLAYWLFGWLRSALGLPCLRERGFFDLLREGLVVLAGIALTSLPMIAYLAAIGILDDTFYTLYAITGIYGDSPSGLFPSPFPPLAQIDAVRLSPDLVLPGMVVNGTNGLSASQGYQHIVAFSGWVDLCVRILYYVPVALFLAVAGLLVQRSRGGDWSTRDEAVLLFFFAAVFLYLTIISFPALHYMTPTLLPLVGLATHWGVHAGKDRGGSARRTGRIGAWSVAGVYCAASLAALSIYIGIERVPLETPRGTLWLTRTTAEIWRGIFEHTESELGAGDRVFAVPYFPLFYFLTEQDHPTRYVALGPGLPGMEAEDEIIDQLEREQVRFVLNAVGVEYKGLESFESSYPRLHRYLTTRFTVEREFAGPFGLYAQYLRRAE